MPTKKSSDYPAIFLRCQGRKHTEDIDANGGNEPWVIPAHILQKQQKRKCFSPVSVLWWKRSYEIAWKERARWTTGQWFSEALTTSKRICKRRLLPQSWRSRPGFLCFTITDSFSRPQVCRWCSISCGGFARLDSKNAEGVAPNLILFLKKRFRFIWLWNHFIKNQYNINRRCMHRRLFLIAKQFYRVKAQKYHER